MVDANQQLSVPEAIHLGRALEPFKLTWFEEPVICHNHEGEGIPPGAAAFSGWILRRCCAAKSALRARLAAQHESDDIDHGERTSAALER